MPTVGGRAIFHNRPGERGAGVRDRRHVVRTLSGAFGGGLFLEDAILSGEIDLESATDVSRLLVEMYQTDLRSDVGVIHVAAVASTGERNVLKITTQTPNSAFDTFVLSTSRARANHIITTGRILREEPTLTHHYLGSEITQRAIAAWRRDIVGIRVPAEILVLTSGKEMDADHPVFAGPGPVKICTSHEGAALLRQRSFASAEIVVLEAPSIRSIIEFAMRRRGSKTVSIEAGPSTTVDLYQHPLGINELLLSTYHGALASSLLGGSFASANDITRLFRRSSTYRPPAPDGEWCFARYLRQ